MYNKQDKNLVLSSRSIQYIFTFHFVSIEVVERPTVEVPVVLPFVVEVADAADVAPTCLNSNFGSAGIWN